MNSKVSHNCLAAQSCARSRQQLFADSDALTRSCALLMWYLGRATQENIMDEKQGPQAGPPAGQVQIKADEKELQGMYSNLVMIQHHAEEFTLNFVYVFPNATQGKLLSSMIVSPGHAKRIWRALGENISRFEALYGPIKEGPEGTPGTNIGFVQ
jgi:Protein of unknown function (DUF3467)